MAGNEQAWDAEQERALRRLASGKSAVVFIEHEVDSHVRARVLNTGSMAHAAFAIAAVKVIAGWWEEAVAVDLYGVTHTVELQLGVAGWSVAGLQRTVQVHASDVVPLSEASLRSQFHPPER